MQTIASTFFYLWKVIKHLFIQSYLKQITGCFRHLRKQRKSFKGIPKTYLHALISFEIKVSTQHKIKGSNEILPKCDDNIYKTGHYLFSWLVIFRTLISSKLMKCTRTPYFARSMNLCMHTILPSRLFLLKLNHLQ